MVQEAVGTVGDPVAVIVARAENHGTLPTLFASVRVGAVDVRAVSAVLIKTDGDLTVELVLKAAWKGGLSVRIFACRVCLNTSYTLFRKGVESTETTTNVFLCRCRFSQDYFCRKPGNFEAYSKRLNCITKSDTNLSLVNSLLVYVFVVDGEFFINNYSFSKNIVNGLSLYTTQTFLVFSRAFHCKCCMFELRGPFDKIVFIFTWGRM